MSAKTHWKKLHNSDYLGAYSLDDGNGKYADIMATIQNLKVETLEGPDGKKEELVMRFVERNIKPMVINATNSKVLEKLFKTPYIEDWSGRKIQIGVEKVKAFGDVVDALRIRKFVSRETLSGKCIDCEMEITAFGDMTAVQVVAYGRKRFGVDLCAECMKKRDAAKKAEKTAADEVITTDEKAPAAEKQEAANE